MALGRLPLYALVAFMLLIMVSQAVAEPVAVEPLPTATDFHPAYTLEDAKAPASDAGEIAPEQITTVIANTTSTADASTDDIEPMPAADPVKQGFELFSWQGDMEDLPPFGGVTKAPAPRPLHAATGKPRITLINPMPDEDCIEGRPVTIRWLSSGPISKVRLYISYELCELAGRSRGSYGKVIGDMIANENQMVWEKAPWMDSASFRLRIAGYDEGGNQLATDEIGLHFRPAEFVHLPDTCIAVLKRKQRLYLYNNGQVRLMHIVSTARGGMVTPKMRPGSYDRKRGAMGKVFRKSTNAWSRSYSCWMPYWLQITSSGSHGIHATSSPFYRYLGSPASHGCIRQHKTDAQTLYNLVSVGTPVYVF